jgi:hypothetical protein
MPKRLKRLTGQGDLPFITFFCYQRRAYWGRAGAECGGADLARGSRAIWFCAGRVRDHAGACAFVDRRVCCGEAGENDSSVQAETFAAQKQSKEGKTRGEAYPLPKPQRVGHPGGSSGLRVLHPRSLTSSAQEG